MFDLFSLKGKTALLTGGTNGIGLGMAQGLVGADLDHLILTYRSEEPLKKTIDILKAINPKVKIDGIYADFLKGTEEELVESIYTQAVEKGGKIDILINNAGINYRRSFKTYPQNEFDEVMRVNLNIPVKLTQKVINHMDDNGIKGSIIFTGSLCSFQGGIDSSAYAITKGGIKLFTASVSNEFSKKGIRVNCIAPGYITTNMTEVFDPEFADGLINRIPMGRWGNEKDFQGPAVFLASDASGYITGETLVVDGGWMNF